MRFGCGRAAAHFIYNPQGIYFSHIFAKKELMEQPDRMRMPKTRRNKRLKRVRRKRERQIVRADKKFDRRYDRLERKSVRVAKRSEKAGDKYLDKVGKIAGKAMTKEQEYSKGGKVAYKHGGKLKVNRRRAKHKDEDGNMVKVKVNKDGSVKKAKYRVSDEPKNRQVAISNMGHMHNRVLDERRYHSERKKADKYIKTVRKNVKRAATENSDAYEDRIRRKKKIKNLSELKKR